MSKPHVLAREFSSKEISTFLSELMPSACLVSYEYLFGGLSTTTVKIELEEKKFAILKIFYPNPSSFSTFENSMNICRYIKSANSDIRIAYPLTEIRFGELGIPAIIMSYIENSIGGNLIEKKIQTNILNQLGTVLAQIHQLRISSELVSYETGGAVDLFDHASGKLLDSISKIDNAEFTELYKTELAESFQNLKRFPIGIIHGDPYLDNVLVSVSDHEQLLALVDFEDACVGPVMFDVGSAIAGGCIDDTGLNWTGIKAFLTGYESVRKLSAIERDAITQFIRIGIMCSCAFRFLTLANTAHSDAYLPLMGQLVFVKNNAALIESKLHDLLED